MTDPQDIPVFKLYGEADDWPTPDLLHCEAIADRSRLHDWVIRPHRHVGLFQILYLRHGSARIQQDTETYSLTAGSVVVVPEMSVHGFEFGPQAEGYILTLAYPLIKRLGHEFSDIHTLFAQFRIGSIAGPSPIDTTLRTLNSEYAGNAPGRRILLESLLAALTVWLARALLPLGRNDGLEAHDHDGDHFGHFCHLIETHFTEHLTVDDYAARIGITSAHLNSLCRKTVNKSALQLIHERLLLEAKRGLVYTAKTISQIADNLGFSDPAYFTRFFKRHTGQSPKTFRKQAGTH